MFDYKGSKKSLQVVIDNVEFSQPSQYFIQMQMEGDQVAKKTETSGMVNNPVFENNRLFIPLHEERLQKNPTLMITALVVSGNSQKQ